MQRDQIRKIINEQVHHSLAAGGVQINAIPAEQLRALVEAMADGIFAAFVAIEQEGDDMIPLPRPATPRPMTPRPTTTSVRPPTPEEPGIVNPAGEDAEEVKVWQGRPYLSIGVRYELTSQRMRIYRGVFGNRIEEIELIRVKDSKVKQHMGERMLNIGDVTIFSADPSTPEIILENVHDPVEVRELLRKAVMQEKARRGLYYREDIGDESH